MRNHGKKVGKFSIATVLAAYGGSRITGGASIADRELKALFKKDQGTVHVPYGLPGKN